MKEGNTIYGYAYCKWGKVFGMMLGKNLIRLALTNGEEEKDMKVFTRNDKPIQVIADRLHLPDFSPKHIEIDLFGSDFHKKVWRELMNVPFGTTMSYSELARKINSNAVRAVGTAVSKNPVAFIIPCHRIIHKDGSIGNYFYGSELKKKILDYERGCINN
jgi:O-6-methylguanine DNA methyltransferase